jgi:eukaryotic-like serine/threonine-protein kinase
MGAAKLPIRPGDVIQDKYRVERVIGRGGMGVVVAAKHVQLGSTVAVKLFAPEGWAPDDPAAERFAREARTAVRLRSEKTARVLDVGSLPDGTQFIVMEYLVGKDLGMVLAERGALPEADAVGYILQACEAVAEAHALGIVHRDLKPHNLFLTEASDGSPLVKVLDFGVAKWSEPAAASLTITSRAMGTPAYMSPEQMRAPKDVDARSDVWSLGVCAYELLTGAPPFQAETVQALCAVVLTETPRALREIRPELTPDVAAVVMRCLEKRPHERYQSVVELAEALEAASSVSRRGRVAAVAARAREVPAGEAADAAARNEATERAATTNFLARRAHETRGEATTDVYAARTRRTAAWGFGGGILLASVVTVFLWARGATHSAQQGAASAGESNPVVATSVPAVSAPPVAPVPSVPESSVEELPSAPSAQPRRGGAPGRSHATGRDAGVHVAPLTDVP